MEFHIPRTKQELVVWLNSRYAGKVKGFYDMKKKQLMAIYINTRKRDGR